MKNLKLVFLILAVCAPGLRDEEIKRGSQFERLETEINIKYWMPFTGGLDKTVAYLDNNSNQSVDHGDQRLYLDMSGAGGFIAEAATGSTKLKIYYASSKARRNANAAEKIIPVDFDAWNWHLNGSESTVTARGDMSVIYAALQEELVIIRKNNTTLSFLPGLDIFNYDSNKNWTYTDPSGHTLKIDNSTKASMTGPSASLYYRRDNIIFPKLSFTGQTGLSLLAGNLKAARKETSNPVDASLMDAGENNFSMLPVFSMSMELDYPVSESFNINLGFASLVFSQLETNLANVDDTSWHIQSQKQDVALGGLTLGASYRF